MKNNKWIKRSFPLILAIGVTIWFVSSNGVTSDEDVCNVSPTELKAKLDAGLDENVVLLDVRTGAEYNAGHLEGCVLANYYGGFKDTLATMDKEKTYYLYCRTGRRSLSATKDMMEMGFKNVCNITEGIVGMEKAGIPVVKDDD